MAHRSSGLSVTAAIANMSSFTADEASGAARRTLSTSASSHPVLRAPLAFVLSAASLLWVARRGRRQRTGRERRKLERIKKPLAPCALFKPNQPRSTRDKPGYVVRDVVASCEKGRSMRVAGGTTTTTMSGCWDVMAYRRQYQSHLPFREYHSHRSSARVYTCAASIMASGMSSRTSSSTGSSSSGTQWANAQRQGATTFGYSHMPKRFFQASARRQIVKPYLLADIGEGITECQIIQWFVRPGARVEQFDKICEVQSDKASVDITSRFDGVIKKLHYEADDMAKVGQPLVDIDIQSDIGPENASLTGPDMDVDEEKASELGSGSSATSPPPPPPSSSSAPSSATHPNKIADTNSTSSITSTPTSILADPSQNNQSDVKRAKLATPAVRHLTKQFAVDIADIQGTGRDGRVLKEDVHRHAAAVAADPATGSGINPAKEPSHPAPSFSTSSATPQTIPLTPIQQQMFKSMTRSLAIPHFLYTDTVDFTRLSALRRRLAGKRQQLKKMEKNNEGSGRTHLSPLPFIVKAVSIALRAFPSLNAHLNITPERSVLPSSSSSSETSTTTNPKSSHSHNNNQAPNQNPKPSLTVHPSHNIGIAMATPAGLLVPIIRNVETLSIAEIAAEIDRLARLGRDGKLGAADLAVTGSNAGNTGGNGGKSGWGGGVGRGGISGAGSDGSEAVTAATATTTLNTGPTFTISNIGSMAAGAGVVAPVVVPPQVAILAVGRAKVVPAFASASASASASAAGTDADIDADIDANANANANANAGTLRVVAREECTFSWSADHRVLDGAMVARCAEMVRELVEGAGEEMLLSLR